MCHTEEKSAPGVMEASETPTSRAPERWNAEIPGRQPVRVRYPMSAANVVRAWLTMGNRQPRPRANRCWTAGESGLATTKAARLSRCGYSPLKPSAHSVQYGHDEPML